MKRIIRLVQAGIPFTFDGIRIISGETHVTKLGLALRTIPTGWRYAQVNKVAEHLQKQGLKASRIPSTESVEVEDEGRKYRVYFDGKLWRASLQ